MFKKLGRPRIMKPLLLPIFKREQTYLSAVQKNKQKKTMTISYDAFQYLTNVGIQLVNVPKSVAGY